MWSYPRSLQVSIETHEPHAKSGNLQEVLQLFYDEFQKHTTAYKSDVYPFTKFREECLIQEPHVSFRMTSVFP